MKFVLVALLAVSSSFANTIESAYVENTVLSYDLKQEVLDAVVEKYPCVDSYGISEVETTMRTHRVDQGVIDRFYTTTFSVKFHYDYHPKAGKLVVESIRWDGSNPTVDWTDITSIEGSVYCD